MNRYTWLIKREFWENRAIWLVPAIIGLVLTLAALFGRVDLDEMPSPDRTRMVSGFVLFAFGFTFFAVMNIYASWYLLDCLHSDRKDRSILFWKSLPISDTETVLAKLFTGVVAIPIVYFIAADVSTLLTAFIVSVRAHSTLGVALWQPDLWLQLQALWLYLIVTTAIWYLPFVGYLMMISAWADRAVVLWSLLPPLGLCLLERWFFGTSRIWTLLRERAFDYLSVVFRRTSGADLGTTRSFGNGVMTVPDSVWRLLDPVGFVVDPATWIGVAVGIAFIVAAIQLRMRRTEV
jgi:ABC-2 type transport system permease protein